MLANSRLCGTVRCLSSISESKAENSSLFRIEYAVRLTGPRTAVNYSSPPRVGSPSTESPLSEQ